MKHVLALLAILLTGFDFATPEAIEAEYSHGRMCLALAGFSEARSDGDAAMATVMRVVANRATDPAQRWPLSLCGVVMQPAQFIGVESWHYPRTPDPAELPTWQRALDLADATIAGTAPVPPACTQATSFHQAARVDGLQPVCRVGSHTFFIEPPADVAGMRNKHKSRAML